MKEYKGIILEMVVVLVLLVAIIVLVDKYAGRSEQCTPDIPDTPTPTIISSPTQTATPSPTPSMPPELTESPEKPLETPNPSETPTPTPSVASVAKKEVESGHTFKPYTRHTAYNVRTSQQYKLQKIALTSSDNGIRMVEDPFGEWRYCVALGTYWAGGHPEHIGRCIDIFMQNGAILKCVLADVKKQEDTKGGNNRYGRTNNDVLEFIVDDKRISQAVKNSGNISKAGEQFEGDVVYMLVYDMWIEGFGKK